MHDIAMHYTVYVCIHYGATTLYHSECLFVRGKRQNYGTNWCQTLRNYKEWPGEGSLWVEIAHLGEILWDLRISFASTCHFYLSPLHCRLLPGLLLSSFNTKRCVSMCQECCLTWGTTLQNVLHACNHQHFSNCMSTVNVTLHQPAFYKLTCIGKLMYMQACCKFNHYKHACLERNYLEALSHCGQWAWPYFSCPTLCRQHSWH